MLPDVRWDFHLLAERVPASAESLRGVGYDVLVYWEIGTDSTNYFLPFFRPARVQVNAWGWPSTSGMAEVDAYLSCDALEPADGESQYTERLVRFRELPTYYLRPPVPAMPRDRSAFGVPADARLYLCQQNVRKYHPEFDEAIAGILRADGRAVVGVIADEQPRITALLRDRFDRVMPDVADRVRVLDRLEREPYLELVATADVVLDTFHYGGGANTVLDAVACGTPVVTRPGRYHRGRWAAAVNRRLGLDALNADSTGRYVDTAVAVAGDPGRREAIRTILRGPGAELFENMTAVREWDAWLADAVAKARAD
jgi:predicted O-linked N-acetylglucosamine transferase (SPINDLY family)